jgi:hypothetical protein
MVDVLILFRCDFSSSFYERGTLLPNFWQFPLMILFALPVSSLPTPAVLHFPRDVRAPSPKIWKVGPSLG